MNIISSFSLPSLSSVSSYFQNENFPSFATDKKIVALAVVIFGVIAVAFTAYYYFNKGNQPGESVAGTGSSGGESKGEGPDDSLLTMPELSTSQSEDVTPGLFLDGFSERDSESLSQTTPGILTDGGLPEERGLGSSSLLNSEG